MAHDHWKPQGKLSWMNQCMVNTGGHTEESIDEPIPHDH